MLSHVRHCCASLGFTLLACVACTAPNQDSLQLQGSAAVETLVNVLEQDAEGISAAVAAEPAANAPLIRGTRPGSKHSKQAETTIRQALDSPTILEFVDTPLTDVMDYLTTLHKINIQIDAKALEDNSINRDTPISINLREVSLTSALKLMLRPLGLTCIIADEVLLVTSQAVADAQLEVRVYNVGSLVMPAGMMMPGEGDNPDINSLAQIVQRAVAPLASANRAPGEVMTFQNLLIVRDTQQVHREVEDLLNELVAQVNAM